MTLNRRTEVGRRTARSAPAWPMIGRIGGRMKMRSPAWSPGGVTVVDDGVLHARGAMSTVPERSSPHCDLPDLSVAYDVPVRDSITGRVLRDRRLSELAWSRSVRSLCRSGFPLRCSGHQRAWSILRDHRTPNQWSASVASAAAWAEARRSVAVGPDRDGTCIPRCSARSSVMKSSHIAGPPSAKAAAASGYEKGGTEKCHLMTTGWLLSARRFIKVQGMLGERHRERSVADTARETPDPHRRNLTP